MAQLGSKQQATVDTKALIEGHKNTIRVIRSDLANPERVLKSIAHCEEVIRIHQRQIDQSRDYLANGYKRIAEHQAAIQRIKLEANVDKVQQLKELAAQMAELQAELSAEGVQHGQ